jgi:hypothetical protein
MHKIEIAQQAIDISMRRRGRVQPFVTIEPRQTALSVVWSTGIGFLSPAQWRRRQRRAKSFPRSPAWLTRSVARGGTVVWDQPWTPRKRIMRHVETRHWLSIFLQAFGGVVSTDVAISMIEQGNGS